MKLVYYTYRKISLLLFVLMAVWGVLFYYAIIDEVVDETDDTLENYAGILIEHALHDPSILETEGSLMSFYKFLPISGKEVPALENPTKIREFRQLSEAAVDMGNRSYKAYEEQKEFIENASHELQIPLAIVRGKVELLAESDNLSEQQMKELDEIYSTLGRAVKLNKSLLLLSRIENGQYTELEDVSVDEILDNLLPDLMDIYEHKQVRLVREKGEQPLVIRCNHSLAQILVSNLVKNALLHNEDGGELRILTTPVSLMIKNTGGAPLDGEKLFRRFYHSIDGKKDSTGLGLAIVRSIARISSLRLTYEWQEGMHCFLLVKENKNNR